MLFGVFQCSVNQVFSLLLLLVGAASEYPLCPLGDGIIDKIKNLYFRQRLDSAVNKYDSNEFDNG
jgi:hypothetical protein